MPPVVDVRAAEVAVRADEDLPLGGHGPGLGVLHGGGFWGGSGCPGDYRHGRAKVHAAPPGLGTFGTLRAAHPWHNVAHPGTIGPRRGPDGGPIDSPQLLDSPSVRPRSARRCPGPPGPPIGTENAGVGGSIPPLPTRWKCKGRNFLRPFACAKTRPLPRRRQPYYSQSHFPAALGTGWPRILPINPAASRCMVGRTWL